MQITSIRYEQFEDHHRVETVIGDRPLWFRMPGKPATDPQDASAFVIAALVPSMLLGEDLVVDDDYFVSQQLLTASEEIQTIYKVWNPIFKKISIIGRPGTSTSSLNRSAVFFSGGVDGTYTALTHLESIDDLILINGFDFTMESATWSEMVSKNTGFATSIDKRLLAVETNFKAFTASFSLARYANFGSVLACTGQLLGHNRVLLSGSDTYRLLRGIGCHPLLDPLWSTEATKTIHTGLEADRSKKLAIVSQSPAALANLWVCWEDPSYNCGHCSKCVRTAIGLKLNQVQTNIFREPVSIAAMSRSAIKSDEDLEYHLHFLHAARLQHDHELTSLLKRKVFRYKFRQFLKDVLEFYLPERGTQWIKNKRQSTDELCDISITPRFSDELTLRTAISRAAESRSRSSNEAIGSVYRIPKPGVSG